MAEADPARRIDTGPIGDGPVEAITIGPVAEPPAKPRGRAWRRILLFSVPLLILAIGGWFWLTSGRYVSTDNSYLKQDVVSVGSDVTGRIVAVNVHENQIVHAGDLLFRIDPSSYRVALDQANASIAQAQVQVQQLQTDYRSTGVDIAGAQHDVAFAQQVYARQVALMARGFTTTARLQETQHDLQSAQQRLQNAVADAAKAQTALATGSQVPGVAPVIAAALAQRERSALDLSRTEIRAPISGRVSQTSRLQIGQMMIIGLPALSIVADNRSWIEANFKETQLAHMRLGQPADVTFDAYPGLHLRGHVESIGAGTGSQFSVLPAQNATGNWVKVTQRVPVRIAIDQASPRQLIAGLSAAVTVDVRGDNR